MIHTVIVWIKNHDTYLALGSLGSLVGVTKYWNHFLDETLFKVIDACIVTILTTVLGLIVAWAYKKVFKV